MTKNKDLNFYSIMYGGYPMTLNGAKMFLIEAQLKGYSLKECMPYIPNKLRADKYKEGV